MFNEEQEDIRDYEQEDSSNAGLIMLLIASSVFLPSVGIGWLLHWLLMRKMKQKPSVITLTGLILGLIGLPFILTFNFETFFNFETLDFGSFLKLYILVAYYLGILYMLGLSYYYAFQLKTKGYIKDIDGYWTYKFEYAKSFIEKYKEKKLIQQLENGDLYEDESTPLGLLIDEVKLQVKDNKVKSFYKPMVIRRYTSEVIKHTITTGASGSGKSITMMNQVTGDVIASRPVIFIDCKNSSKIAYKLSKLAKQYGREFYHFAPGRAEYYYNPFYKKKSVYDPLTSGSVDYKTELLMNLRQYDEAAEVYKHMSRTVLSTVSWLIENCNKSEVPQMPWNEGGLAVYVAALNPESVLAMIISVEKEIKKRGLENDYQFTKAFEAAKHFYESINKTNDKEGLSEQTKKNRSSLNNLMLSSYGEWLSSKDGYQSIDISKIVNNPDGPIVLFSLASLESPDISKDIGSIILGNIAQIADQYNKKSSSVPTSLYIDEVQTMNINAVTGILEKAREAGIGVTLSLQSLEQIPAAGNDESVLIAILDNCSNFIIHAGSTQETAKRFADILGKEEITKYNFGRVDKSRRVMKLLKDLHLTSKLDEDYKVSPRKFQSLSIPVKENGFESTAYYITKQSSEKRFKKNIGPIGCRFQSIVPYDIVQGIPKKIKDKYEKSEELINEYVREVDHIIEDMSNVINNSNATTQAKVNVPVNKMQGPNGLPKIEKSVEEKPKIDTSRIVTSKNTTSDISSMSEYQRKILEQREKSSNNQKRVLPKLD